MVKSTGHGRAGVRRTALTVLALVFASAFLGTVATSVAAADPIESDAAIFMAAPADASDWTAWVNAMPPGPRSLHVQGTVTVPTPGYLVRLVKAAPQGFNPRNLILDLTLTSRPGIWPQVVTRKSVSFRIDRYANQYDSILVRFPDGSGLTLPISVAQ